MDRCFQVLLIASTAGFSWLGMQAVHELGSLRSVRNRDGPSKR